MVDLLAALPSLPMGYPRRHTVPDDTRGIYHCVSRCVRRAFLCGVDSLSGRSFEHRKYWIEHRLLELANVFSVAVHAYAVMSNHVHVVIEVDPETAATWSSEDVARRWLTVFGRGGRKDATLALRVAAIIGDLERVAVLRRRLGSLSWFMRALNEPIARRANREDECTGRFWEGRFKCQALLDDAALLACMAYVDLNPVRAGTASLNENSPHTSAWWRARRLSQARKLEPISGSIVAHVLDISERRYLQLLEWTGKELHSVDGKRMPDGCSPVLNRLSMNSKQWLIQVSATESHYWRAVGSAQALIEQARRFSCRWLKGVGFARHLSTLSKIA